MKFLDRLRGRNERAEKPKTPEKPANDREGGMLIAGMVQQHATRSMEVLVPRALDAIALDYETAKRVSGIL